MSIELISKYRKQIMAVGMIWLALFHMWVAFDNKALKFVINTCGYAGVDIFMFLSGFGLYFSYKKDSNYWNFLKKRIIKIFPYNIIICFITMILMNKDFWPTLGDALGLSLFFRIDLSGWYTSLMLVLYLLTPLYIKLFIKHPKLVYTLVLIPLAIICGYHENITYTVFSYKWFRIAIYITGIAFAYMYDNKKKCHEYIWLILFFVGWVLMVVEYHYFGNWRQHVYPLLLSTPGTVLICGYVFNKIKILNKPLAYISQYSYQFYMIDVLTVQMFYFNYDKLRPCFPGGNDNLFNITATLLAFILSVILTKIVEGIKNIIINRRSVKV